MNYGYYQPEMPGLGSTCQCQPMATPNMMPSTMPGIAPGAGQYPTDTMQLNQIERRLTRLEQQVRTLDTRLSRLETPFQGGQNFDMPESTYPSTMHMM